MALSYVDYTSANTTAATWAFTFPRLSDDNVKVKYAGVVQSHTTMLTNPDRIAVWTDGNLNVSKGVSVSGDLVRVYRETPGTIEGSEIMLVDFADGSILTEADLDKAAQQLLYISQEYGDHATASLKKTSSGETEFFDSESIKISNVADPVDSQDAVTKSVFDTSIAAVGGITIAPQVVSLSIGHAAAFATNTVIAIPGVVLNTYQNTRVICVVGGVIQRPDTDFTVASAGADTTLTILGEDITSADVTLYPISIQIPY